MGEQLFAGTNYSNFNVDSTVDLPQNPSGLAAIRRPQTPTTFSVSFTPDGAELLFTVGYQQRNDGRYYMVNTFNVYFAPMSGTSQVTVSNPATAANTYKNATLVNTITANPSGGAVTFTDSRFVSADGFFWAVAIGANGQQSAPTTPYRAPAASVLINLAIPPNATTVGISKTSPVVDGVTYSLVKATAVVPSNNQGVITVTMLNQGTGYALAGTLVTFTGGLAAGGVAATGNPVVDAGGRITSVQLATSGSGYVSAPTVVFTGAGSLASAVAVLGTSTAFDGFQLYLTNYFGGPQTEGPYVNASGQRPGTTVTGSFYLLPDAGHTTTFTFVSVSRAGSRNLSGAPTATLIV